MEQAHQGQDRGRLTIISSKSRGIFTTLPDSYTNVPPAILQNKCPIVPVIDNLKLESADLSSALEDEYR